MKRSSYGLMAAIFLVPAIALAETMYVTDRVTVGLRADVTPDAAIVKTVATGDALEVLERNGSLVKVRDGAGAEGWIEATALLAQPPAAQQLRTLRSELERTRAQLIDAQTELDKTRDAPAPETGRLRAEVKGLRERLVGLEGALKEKETELAAKAKEAAAALTAKAATEQETVTLRRAITQRNQPAPIAPSEPPPEFSFLWLAIAFAMLVVGFVGGMVWVKESIRRRMGGMYLRI